MPNKKQSKAINHSFRGCREAFLTPASRSGVSNSPFVFQSDATGNISFAAALAPLGLTATTLGASSYTAGTIGNVMGPPLRGFYNRSVDFQWYRITRAKLVFVSNAGSTVIGTITLAGYTDAYDSSVVTTNVFASGPNTRTFDLSSGATKELSVPVPVDTSWKKVSSVLSVPGNTYPFTASSGGSLLQLNTLNDLACGSVSAYIQGGPVSNTNLGSLFLDYDIEFKGPIDFTLNL